MKPAANTRSNQPSRVAWDVTVTLILWTYFILGFIFLFAPFYGLAVLLKTRREPAYQQLNHLFFRGFILLVRVLIPGHRWRIDKAAMKIRSAVVVCNHRSYLDPLILISLYGRQKTIVKSWLFTLPVFGRLMQWSGYIPSSSQGRFADLMLRQVESLDNFISAGGNLFIFPEGTRSRDGCIGHLSRSTFKIARRCRAPIRVLFVNNTEKLFRPGQFRFETQGPNTISVQMVGGIDSDDWSDNDSVNTIASRVQKIWEKHNRLSSADPEESIQSAPLE